jgi:hypothetical protein
MWKKMEEPAQEHKNELKNSEDPTTEDHARTSG